MKKMPICGRLVVLLVWFAAVPAAWSEGELRTWTSSKGTTVEAQLVEANGSSVKLKTAEGRIITLKLSQLSEADQEFITNRPEEKGGAEVAGIDAHPGSTSEAITCAEDPDWSYHLYLPEDFHTGRNWPVWFIMDPGGGSARTSNRYKKGAELLGCILAVSVESKNGFDKSHEAMEAMVKDVFERLPVEEGLAFSSGFSGGSRMAFLLAERDKNVNGVLACGSGGGVYLPDGSFREAKLRRSTYVYSLIGTNCFNRTGSFKSHESFSDDCRLRYFPGGHSWAPEGPVAEGMARVLGEVLKADGGSEAAAHRARFAKAAWSLAESVEDDQPWEAHFWAGFLADYPDAGSVASKAAEKEESLASHPEVALAEEAEEDIHKFSRKFFKVFYTEDKKENPARQEAADKIAVKYDGIAYGEIIKRLGGKS